MTDDNDNKNTNLDIRNDIKIVTSNEHHNFGANNSNGGGGDGNDGTVKSLDNAPLTTTTDKGLPLAPNSKPREEPVLAETYVYRDFANAEPSALDTETCHKRMPPQSLQSQKLPSKLAAMLSDPDLAAIITWMPHGRSWKILNRELFSSFALPPYFGHSNYASFVRIINAWGFRRISVGIDRDSYYHELFLRGKPRLHERMKRLSSCHRKTPIDKDGKCPDFNVLSKTSPLPEDAWNTGQRNSSFPGGALPPNVAAATGAGAFPPRMNHSNRISGGSYMPDAVKPIHFGDAAGAFSSTGGSGVVGANSSFSMADKNPMASLLRMKDSHMGSSGNGSVAAAQSNADVNSLNSYTQILQRENENLMLKIKLLEYENESRQQQQDQQQAAAADGSKQQSNAYGESNTSGGGVNVAGIGALSYNTNTNTNFFNQT